MIFKKLLGQILTDMGFVTTHDLELAIQRQGEMIIGRISPANMRIDRLISESRITATRNPLLGETLIDMGFITEEQLEEALSEQNITLDAYRSLDIEKLATAIEIGSDLNSYRSLSDLLLNIMKNANQLTNSVASTLMLLDEESGELVFSVPTGPKADQLIDIRIPTGKGIAGWVVENDKPILVPDVSDDPRFFQEIDNISSFKTQSILCVPLKAKAKLIGVLEVINKVDGTSFTEEDSLLLGIFASQAALAIDSASFYKELIDSEEKYRQLFDNSPLGIGIADEHGNIITYNDAMLKPGGYSHEDMAKIKNIGELYYNPEEREQILAKSTEQGFLDETEVLFKRKDGTPYNAIISLRLINIGDKNCWQAMVRDITARKRMEEELLRAQKLESVGLLAGGIAHDFNNILTTILGNISMAKTQVASGDEIFEMLSEAEMASLRAQTLTKQLLTFAKGGAPVKETASIKDIIKESSLFVLRGSKSNCEFSIAEDLWPAEVDVGQISQVINNIVINANQAMPEGGIIQVSAENLIIDDKNELLIKPGRYIRISIKDQGVGIAEKHLVKIFDPYFTTKYAGSGLGLATSYSIIKKHHGHITVESQSGVGTTFHIYLPASGKVVTEKEEIKIIKGHGRILVMDDEVALKKMIGRMLKKLGYESEFAKDGAEAIELYKAAKKSEKTYDAVILDLTIPGGMGGKEAIKKLLEIDPEVKAIVSSGYSDDPVLANFQEYGFKGMMPKPFESLSLGKVLHEVLKGEKE